MPRERKPAAKEPSQVFCFKITLLDIKPPIWRRIEVPDGTLDRLHQHIQAVMGWTNSHLHQFDIAGQRYGAPDLLDDGCDEQDIVDSTKLRLSSLLDKKKKPFHFLYEYDFGDGWCHQIDFEGADVAKAGVKYPRCVEGARACPPEDCGGPWGYPELLVAIRDPQHERHDELLEWMGDEFDSEAFDPKETTQYMQGGLPDWRDSR